MHISAIAGGVGGARFLRGLLAHLAASPDPARRSARVTAVVNTGDDTTMHGLRITPDLDTVMYTLGGAVHEEQGWGRRDESRVVSSELAAYGTGPDWFTLGDRDLGTHVFRTQLLREGLPLSGVVERLCERWLPGGHPAVAPDGPTVRLLPMSDDDVETHVHLADGRTVHFQEWWVRLRASVPATGFTQVGVDGAKPAPGVLDALREADAVLLPPSNPVVSIGTVLGVPGVREALRDGGAPVVGVSPVLGGRVVRGMADACLSAIGVETSALGVAGLYADLLDTWLVDDDADGALHGSTVPGAAPGRGRVLARPLLMSSPQAAADLAGAALDAALATGRRPS
ncbi:2-phospho-L-lactate transferase [Streptomyces sp. NP160]|uniref:2-phospho-L-lactate transferase n=1 Tax=Streptomyces sp. NP160 TaxID=2586637 RepID=UPI0011198DC1|nr:2-phospho-L-lactate transferase [Streptomyces sp. NP160]TNM68734.1 2-phospho-L-lactate transferase [Streptomyces sp. NP160]